MPDIWLNPRPGPIRRRCPIPSLSLIRSGGRVTHARTAQRHTRRLAAGAVIAAVVAGLIASQSSAAPVDPGSASTDALPNGMVVRGGVTQPVIAAADVITERIWVETTIDTDGDGRHDR